MTDSATSFNSSLGPSFGAGLLLLSYLIVTACIAAKGIMVTLREVARAAGVSTATASRALADPGSAPTPGRERVWRAARDLRYQVNPAARALATGRAGHVALLVPDLSNPFFATIVKGAQSRARDLGVTVLVGDSDENPETEASMISAMSDQSDGLVLCSPRTPTEHLAHLALGQRTVLVNRRLDGVASVTVDHLSGIHQALAHLRALGHHRIGYVGGPITSWSEHQRRRGLTMEGVEIVDLGHFRPVPSGGVSAADLATGARVTAVLAYNDLIAMGVLQQLRKRGIRVPDEMSVVGFDDIPAATLVEPALTSIALPLNQVGREAIELLISGSDQTQRSLPVDLVVRSSTAPARHAARAAATTIVGSAR